MNDRDIFVTVIINMDLSRSMHIKGKAKDRQIFTHIYIFDKSVNQKIAKLARQKIACSNKLLKERNRAA